MMQLVAQGDPTKQFFIYMITKDISLHDAILDLIDNSIDGAHRSLTSQGQEVRPTLGADYSPFSIDLRLSADRFVIDDDCGGIPVDLGRKYAFRFGRAPEMEELSYGIGAYGIGMKRAVLKMGTDISVTSGTETEGFQVQISVSDWLAAESWDFSLTLLDSPSLGTTISVEGLYPGISLLIASTDFANRLAKVAARDYSFFLQAGLTITINGEPVAPYDYLLKSDDSFAPLDVAYDDPSGVHVQITAGLASTPPIDNEPETIDHVDTEYFGWFVACNDRIVLAGDKSRETIWGVDGFPTWHPQYNGFMGIVRFWSDDVDMLPWTTTKRSLEGTNQVFRRALPHLRAVTREYLLYTNKRKAVIDHARDLEKYAATIPLKDVMPNDQLRLPTYSQPDKEQVANILYTRSRNEVLRVAECLGNRSMPYKEVGIRTFEYYIDAELPDE